MAHHNTVFSQILKLVPRHEFSSLSIKHDGPRRSDAMSRWTQFIAIETNNRTADTGEMIYGYIVYGPKDGIFRYEMKLIIYYNQALIRLISYSSNWRLII